MVDTYFMDARSKLLDIAAFMDRVERFGETEDFRYHEFLKALEGLGGTDRVEAILQMLSDPSEIPSESAGNPAVGAFRKQ